MKVSELVPVDHICIGWPTRDIPKSKNKWKLIQSIIQFLCEKDGYSENIHHEIYQMVRDREKVHTTAIGHGIALPHASLTSIKKASGACVILPEGLDFEAIDHETVNIIFLALLPDKDYKKHISTLSNIVQLTSEHENREKLLNSDSPQKIWNEISHLEE